MQAEFDKYIDDYRTNLTKALTLSGHSSTYFAQYKAKKLAFWLKSLTNQAIKILDFGCGDGMMTDFVAKEFAQAQLFGVDPSPKSIKAAQLKYPAINFCLNSQTTSDLPFEDNEFDIIYSAGTFHHIPFEQHSAYLHELKRITKKNSYIVILELNPLNPLTVLTFKRNPIDYNAQMLMFWYCKKLVRSAGKSAIKFYCFFPKWFSWLQCIEPWLEKIPFGALYAVIIKT